MLKIFSGAITTGDEAGGITVNEESATDNNDDFNFLLNNLNAAAIKHRKLNELLVSPTSIIREEIGSPSNEHLRIQKNPESASP